MTRAPTGLRRLSVAMLAAARTAERFTGTREGASTPGKVLAAFKAAAPYLGITPRLVHAIDWLFKFTQPQDWEQGSRPLVWPSAAMQREALGLGPTQVKALNRLLIEASLILMRDSPNGKRYGRRNSQGRIVEAYGFDLAPLAARQAEFLAVAAQGKAVRERMRLLRRRCTIARNGLRQILETVAELGLDDADWQRLEEEGRALAHSLQKVEQLEEMERGVAALERRQHTARERLASLLPTVNCPQTEAGDCVDSDPKGPENRPLIILTNHTPDPKKDTVMASKRCKAGADRAELHSMPQERPREPQEGLSSQPHRTDAGTVMRMSTDELVRLAPKLRAYLRTSTPTWPDIVDAADWLRHDLGVSKPLWGEACMAMGRETAAIALAIVSAKPREHFTSSPGGYFYGMVAKAKAGELNLARTVWGLRIGSRGKDEGHTPRRRA
jgi:replication initiation protein RepC